MEWIVLGVESVRSGKCEEWKVLGVEVESVRSGKCKEWKVLGVESVRSGKC